MYSLIIKMDGSNELHAYLSGNPMPPVTGRGTARAEGGGSLLGPLSTCLFGHLILSIGAAR